VSRTPLVTSMLALAAIAVIQTPAGAQRTEPKLHISSRWKECSFQLDSSLTQSAWHQFTQEAGLVAYFRPLSDARPMGRGSFEVSMVQWQTGINASDAAWNDTFVHPDSTHWLFEGNRLKFPGLMLRAGVTTSTDVGLYVTKNPKANYGFYGAQLQQNLVRDTTSNWAASARGSFVSIYGPADLDFTVYGVDLVASRRFGVTRWMSVSPYAGVSSYLASSHDKSAVVALDDEKVLGAQATVGATAQLSAVRLGVEYSVARVRSVSLKIGVGR
jgi:hypothetical protein